VVVNPAAVGEVRARCFYGKATVVLAAALLLLSGCAPISPNAKYLFAPEVRTCPPTLSSDSGKSQYSEDYSCWARIDEPRPAQATQGQRSSLTVSQATNYARQIEEEYIGAKSEYGSISSATGLLLIPAGASALALGAEGGSAAAVSALGFGSAGVLGLGYWLSNTKREKVYMTGSDALECLIGTMQPFDVEQTDFAKLYVRRNDMLSANKEVASKASYLELRLTRVNVSEVCRTRSDRLQWRGLRLIWICEREPDSFHGSDGKRRDSGSHRLCTGTTLSSWAISARRLHTVRRGSDV
jgi:hypothetical protein